jgi:hypothetical protein
VTAIAEDLDLSAAGLAPDCDVRPCVPLEAAAILWWDSRCCEANSAAHLLCEPHAGTVRGMVAEGAFWRCTSCGAVRHVARIEPLR